MSDKLDKEELKRRLREAGRRKKKKQDWKPERFFFPQQLEIHEAIQSGERYVCLRCGRRGGKSWFWSGALVSAGIENPGSTPIFICLSRQDARDILWPALEGIRDNFNVRMTFNRATGDVTLDDVGSRILLRGAGSLREINKARGRRYPAAVVDEAQMFGPDLEYLLDEVLEPATADYHGWIGVSGTPAAAPVGPFYEIDQGKHKQSWAHFSWTFLDNPHMPNPQEFIRKVMARRGWDESHPGFQREYLGMWVHDESARAFRLPPHSIVPEFPFWETEDWQWALGIDVGYNDPCAFVVLAYSVELGMAYVVDSYQETEISGIETLAHAERLSEMYPIEEIVVDTGGGGKLVAEDWKRMTSLPIVAADKAHKASKVDILNGDMDAGKLKICRDNNVQLIGDLMVLEWDADKLADGKYIYRKGFQDHRPDALQYVYSLANHQMTNLVGVKPRHDIGSREYWEEKEKAWEQAALKRVEDRERDQGSIFSLLS